MLRVVNAFDMMMPALETQLAIDGTQYRETLAFIGNPADDRGTFLRLPGGVEFHPLFDPLVAGTHPVRLAINGGESQPFWIITP